MRKTHPLRRAVLAGAGTVSAVVLLLALKPTTDPSLAQDAAGLSTPVASAVPADAGATSSAPTSPPASASTSASASASGSASPSAVPSASRTTTAPTKTSAPIAPRTTSGTSGASGTSGGSTTRSVAGATISTQYGSVQVQITVKGSTITGVTALKSPSSTPRSREISADAIPQLDQRSLAAQSANIDSVSGATYTSAGYRQSLQSALDRAGV
ncbi:FMN-binding protein [Streptomyces sp. NPDC051909]|uniref:FMN-binding protein n=1 Tax=Streptomyces sp. NPDC051909 TaxID=3154944 RepID=UPI0034313811